MAKQTYLVVKWINEDTLEIVKMKRLLGGELRHLYFGRIIDVHFKIENSVEVRQAEVVKLFNSKKQAQAELKLRIRSQQHITRSIHKIECINNDPKLKTNETTSSESNVIIVIPDKDTSQSDSSSEFSKPQESSRVQCSDKAMTHQLSSTNNNLFFKHVTANIFERQAQGTSRSVYESSSDSSIQQTISLKDRKRLERQYNLCTIMMQELKHRFATSNLHKPGVGLVITRYISNTQKPFISDMSNSDENVNGKEDEQYRQMNLKSETIDENASSMRVSIDEMDNLENERKAVYTNKVRVVNESKNQVTRRNFPAVGGHENHLANVSSLNSKPQKSFNNFGNQDNNGADNIKNCTEISDLDDSNNWGDSNESKTNNHVDSINPNEKNPLSRYGSISEGNVNGLEHVVENQNIDEIEFEYEHEHREQMNEIDYNDEDPIIVEESENRAIHINENVNQPADNEVVQLNDSNENVSNNSENSDIQDHSSEGWVEEENESGNENQVQNHNNILVVNERIRVNEQNDVNQRNDDDSSEHNISSTVEPLVESMLHNRNVTTSKNGMVSLGEGYLIVPLKKLQEIDWSESTKATRKLVKAAFPRKILATHNVSGKQSPAFLGKPAKKRLNRYIVKDIINTVMTRCKGASDCHEIFIKKAITAACSYEAQLYFKNREKKRRHKEENISPDSDTNSDTTKSSTD